jgi:hypothetical protein
VIPYVTEHRGAVQARAEHLPVRGVQPVKVQAEPTYPAVPDLHRGEVAVAGGRDGSQLLHGGAATVDLNANGGGGCHRPS